MLTRRDFVKSGCLTCIGSLAGIQVLLEACSPKALPLLNYGSDHETILKVPLEKFGTGKSDLLILRTTRLSNDILLIKEKQDQFRALYLECTHEGLSLTPTSSKIYCAAHGSAFDLEGNILTEPALKPLKQFKTKLIEDQIVIYLI